MLFKNSWSGLSYRQVNAVFAISKVLKKWQNEELQMQNSLFILN